MPNLLATASVSLWPDWPKPPVSETSATLVRLRFFISANTRSAAIRSVGATLNTHFFVGSMIGTPAAIEMNGVPDFSMTGIAAIVPPVVVPPRMTSTWSLSISRLAKLLALLASLPSS